MAFPNFYMVLGVPENATHDDIRKAYKKRILECHPDHNPGNTEKLEEAKLVIYAYKVLSDSKTRMRYDDFLLRPDQPIQGQSYSSWEHSATDYTAAYQRGDYGDPLSAEEIADKLGKIIGVTITLAILGIFATLKTGTDILIGTFGELRKTRAHMKRSKAQEILAQLPRLVDRKAYLQVWCELEKLKSLIQLTPEIIQLYEICGTIISQVDRLDRMAEDALIHGEYVDAINYCHQGFDLCSDCYSLKPILQKAEKCKQRQLWYKKHTKAIRIIKFCITTMLIMSVVCLLAHHNMVVRQIDENDWKRAVRKDNTESYQKYLDLHPEGIHSDESWKAMATARANVNMANLWQTRNQYEKAFSCYQKAAAIQSNDSAEKEAISEAMHSIGGLYCGGYGVAIDYGQAARWYRKAAEAGNSTAMGNLGQMYEEGLGVKMDHTQAELCFQRASSMRIETLTKHAEAGDTFSMNALGDFYNGNRNKVLHEYDDVVPNVDTDEAKSAQWYLKAAKAGDEEAMLRMVNRFSIGKGVDKDEKQAFNWCLQAAKSGNAEAMGKLVKMYQEGVGVVMDKSQADLWSSKAVEASKTQGIHWWLKKAENGDADAMYSLGKSYERGLNVEQDMNKAVEWLHKAAEEGNSDAMFDLGVMYYIGVNRDDPLAEQWFRKAAEEDNVDAMNYLGLMYLKDRCVTQDLYKAPYWFHKAADYGSDAAMLNLARLYEGGFWPGADKDMAIKWFRKAAQHGNARAQRELEWRNISWKE